MKFENSEEIVLAKSAQVVIDRYLELSMNVIAEFIANCDQMSFLQCKKLLSAKYRNRSQNTSNEFFECTLEATFILLEEIFLKNQPFFPELFMGICSGKMKFLLVQGIIVSQKIDPEQRFIVYLRKGRYFIYFIEQTPPDKANLARLDLFFGGNKLLKLSNGQRFNYFRQLSKKQHRYYKRYKDPIRVYHEQICQQIMALHPQKLAVTANDKVTGAYLEEQLRLRKRLNEIMKQELSPDN
ncbi:hypothetical protein R7892_05005 [Ligilactobacillus murinus]|uniref:hypothetical protein n=1 Tax=Ligilactobacillus murinus TaxID=1622 RepID=UPI00296B1CA8|nr:hypothetical protein [Ligilactobacillus murinus]WOY90073.1 hypothetical protein R7892_05005 [Ligilactobacillus murinus]